MRGKTIVCILAFLLTCAGAFSQLACDPNDGLYEDLKLWEDRGILHNLPPLRPYPIQILRGLLGDVLKNGTSQDALRAEKYMSSIQGLANAHVLGDALVRGDGEDTYSQFELKGTLQGSVDPLLSYSGGLGVVLNNGPANSLMPSFQRPTVDYIYDGGVVALPGTHIIPRVSSASSAAFGTDALYVQAGDIRGSFGPFWGDSTVLSPSSPQAGQYSLVVRQELFTVTEVLLAVSAMDSAGTAGPFPDKYVALHSLDLNLLPWFSISVFDCTVWGGRWDMLYLLPFSSFYYTQGLTGQRDNSFVGLSGTLRLPANVRADIVVYVDDASFNDLVRLNFNTLIKASVQLGLSWTPNAPFLTRLSLVGMIITPYTYTHTNNEGDLSGDPNYLDYTNNGQNIGPALDPNSALLEARALLRPDPALDVSPYFRMVFHGNASEGLYDGSGTVFDNGFSEKAYWTFRFLTQSVIEKTLQGGITVAAWPAGPLGALRISAGGLLQYVMNSGLRAGESSTTLFLTLGLRCLL